jgi:hypothetical protein
MDDNARQETPAPRPRLNRRQRQTVLAVGSLLLLVLFVPLPWPMRQSDREYAVRAGLASLFEGRRVLQVIPRHWPRWSRLVDSEFMTSPDKRLYYRDTAGLPEELFRHYRLAPLPDGFRPNLDGGDAVVGVEMAQYHEGPGPRLYFSYSFGSLGAQGWEVRVWRSLLLRHAVFVLTWVS